MVSPPLQGLRVLDLSRLLPGPFCTLILSDLGASVDKLEDLQAGDYLRVIPPLKGGLAGRFNALNRDKRSLCLDLKSDVGRKTLLRMIPRYNIVVESFRPGVMDRLGVGYEQLSTVNPRLIYCAISGYGQSGPYRNRAGHDINYNALAGVLGMSGPRDGDPVLPGVQIADIAGGALWAAVGILAALHGAKATGRGRIVDVSMCEGALAFMIPDLGNMDASGTTPTRSSDMINGGAACYGIYRTADGEHLSVGALEPKFWMAFNQAIGRTCDPSELLGPLEVQTKVRAEVQAILATRTRAEWAGVFASADACVEPILHADELIDHPQHKARGLFFRLGELLQVRTPFGADTDHTPPPKQGEHTLAILRECGVSETEIAVLRTTGAIR